MCGRPLGWLFEIPCPPRLLFSPEEVVPNTQPPLTQAALSPRGIYAGAVGSAGEGASHKRPFHLEVLPLCTLRTITRVCVSVSFVCDNWCVHL